MSGPPPVGPGDSGQEVAHGPAPDRPGDVVSAVQAVIAATHLLMKTLASHGAEHPLTVQNAEELCHAIRTVAPPFSLQFVGQATFKDRELVPLGIKGFQMAQVLAKAMRNLSLHEISFDRVPEPRGAMALAAVLVRGMSGPSDAAGRVSIPGLAWREIPSARLGADREQVDPEVMAVTQIALAIADAETLVAKRGTPWSWNLGMSIVRRVERALETGRPCAVAAVELAPGPWSPARRAVSAVVSSVGTLQAVEAHQAVRRAAGHAALALCCTALGPREGLPIDEAAKAALEALLDVPSLAKSGLEPHRVRVCSIAYLLAQEEGDPRQQAGVLPLVKLCYELARRRCPAGVSFDLTGADLMAWAISAREARSAAPWVRLLIDMQGTIPPGAAVLLPDGRVGLVLESTPEDPLHPTVLVGAEMIPGAGPVRLLAGALLK
jgi:hypothetical protein